MQQEFEPRLPRDILKMSKNKSFYFRARFGAIYSASKIKKYFSKNGKTPAAYILMYYNTFSTTFTAVRCFQLKEKVLRLDASSYQSSDRTVPAPLFMTTK